MRYPFIAFAATAALLGCASGGGSLDRGDARRAAYSSDVIMFDELARFGAGAPNLYAALERARPAFIRVRGSGRLTRPSAAQIDVFINGGYAGDANILLTLQPSQVASVRFERRSQAFVRHGAWLRGENVLYVTLLR
ncbi:MAG: hypothetical protein ACT4R6_10845 [Gemmatimonadaceae bacterium]